MGQQCTDEEVLCRVKEMGRFFKIIDRRIALRPLFIGHRVKGEKVSKGKPQAQFIDPIKG